MGNKPLFTWNMTAEFNWQRQFSKTWKPKFSKFVQGKSIRHNNKYTNESFKRSLASFYRSYSEINEELIPKNKKLLNSLCSKQQCTCNAGAI